MEDFRHFWGNTVFCAVSPVIYNNSGNMFSAERNWTKIFKKMRIPVHPPWYYRMLLLSINILYKVVRPAKWPNLAYNKQGIEISIKFFKIIVFRGAFTGRGGGRAGALFVPLPTPLNLFDIILKLPDSWHCSSATNKSSIYSRHISSLSNFMGNMFSVQPTAQILS